MMLNTTIHEFRALVRNWQESHGLKVDGIIGPKTRASLRRYVGDPPDVPSPMLPPGELDVGTVPMKYEGHTPVVTDGFGRDKRGGKGHLGVDLMFKRIKAGEVRLPSHTRWFWCPTGQVMAVACAPGEVIRIVRSKSQGIAVYIKHGRYMSVYRHLTTTPLVYGSDVTEGEFVGIVGHAPKAGKRGINHLHFEIWDTDKAGLRTRDRKKQAIDPGPFLARWSPAQ